MEQLNTLKAVDKGDKIGVEYESIHSDAMADTQTEILTVVDDEWSTVAENDDGERFTLRTDGGTVTEIAKHDKYDNPRRVGYPERITRMGWA